MPAYKDETRNNWYCAFYYEDWNGERKKKMKRGFETKKAAQDWERQFLFQRAADTDMALCGMDPIIPYHEILLAIKRHKTVASHACLHDGVNVCQSACRCADFFSGELMADRLKYEAYAGIEVKS